MKYLYLLILLFMVISAQAESANHFQADRDFILLQFDSKTDVDDLHTIAAAATLFRLPPFQAVHHHAVAGTYGEQQGLYVPSPKLFDMAFPENWSDRHNRPDQALEQVVSIVTGHLDKGANIWVVEAGQSNFTARWLKQVARLRPGVALPERIYVVQHSDWNEQQTSPADLAYVKAHANYQKIPDGNATGNGSPGFKTFKPLVPGHYSLPAEVVDIWERAIILASHYNGLEGRYNNDAVAARGLDFSDTAELCWILGLNDLADAEAFFTYVRQHSRQSP